MRRAMQAQVYLKQGSLFSTVLPIILWGKVPGPSLSTFKW